MTEGGHSDFFRAIEIRKSKPLFFHLGMQWIAQLLKKYTKSQFGIPRFIAWVGRSIPWMDRLIVAGPDGKDFIVKASQNGFGIVTGGYGVSEIRPFINFLPRDAVALDVGANFGIWSRLLGDCLTHGRLYAFEPSPESFSIL